MGEQAREGEISSLRMILFVQHCIPLLACWQRGPVGEFWNTLEGGNGEKPDQILKWNLECSRAFQYVAVN